MLISCNKPFQATTRCSYREARIKGRGPTVAMAPGSVMKGTLAHFNQKLKTSVRVNGYFLRCLKYDNVSSVIDYVNIYVCAYVDLKR
jgi:hypothetical protein